MSKPTAFLTSVGVGICVCHTIPIPMIGVVAVTSGDKSAENMGAARVGDIVIGACGHIGVLVAGSSNVTSDNRSQTTISSPFVGCFNGIIVSGAGSHFTGG